MFARPSPVRYPVPRAKRPVEAEGSSHLLTLKVNEGVSLFSCPAALHIGIDYLVRIVDFSGLRLIGFTFVGNHIHINLRIPAGSRDTPAIDELMRRLDRLYGVGRNPPARGRYEIDIAAAFANGSEPFVMHRMGRRSEFAKSLAESLARELRKDATQPGHLWCGVYHTTELAGPGAHRRVAVYIDSNRSAAHIDHCPGDSTADGFGRAVAGDKAFQQNYCELYGVPSWPEARRLHSLALADYGSRRHAHKRPLDLDAIDRLRNDRVRPCPPGSEPTPRPMPAGYLGCINLLRIARSVRVHDPVDEAAIRATNRSFDPGKRASLPCCDLVGFRQTRESKYDPKDINDPFGTPPPPAIPPTPTPPSGPQSPAPSTTPAHAPDHSSALTARIDAKPTHGPGARTRHLHALRDGQRPVRLMAETTRHSRFAKPPRRARARTKKAALPAPAKTKPARAHHVARPAIRASQHRAASHSATRPTPLGQLCLAAARLLARTSFPVPGRLTRIPTNPLPATIASQRLTSSSSAVSAASRIRPDFGTAKHPATGPPRPKAA